MKLLRFVGIEAEVELIFPAELEAGFGKRIVANLRAGMALRPDLLRERQFYR